MGNYLKKVFGILFVLLLFVSCLTPSTPSAWAKKRKFSRKGVFHIVKKGQTLWRIAKSYNVPIQKIRAANRLKNTHQIQAGQKLWIPGARKVLSVPPTCPSQLSSPQFFWPLKGKIIREFGQYGLQHFEGIDIQAPINTSVKAASGGRVIYAGNDLKGYGKVIIIQHNSGYSTIYANNKENLVKAFVEVKSGQIIARVGGGEAGGGVPYLHFEIRHHHQALDPISFLR